MPNSGTWNKIVSAFRLEKFIARGGVQGGAWLGGGTAIAQVLKFGRNILLTRLLAPEAFGLMALVLATSSLFDQVTDIGVKEAIVQNPRGKEPGYINAAWWMGTARACALYALIFVSVPWISSFYGEPRLTPLMRTALIGVVFYGAMSSRAYQAWKNMEFKQWALIQYSGAVLGTLVTLTLALLMRNVWALAIGFASENVIRCATSYVLYPFRPRFQYESKPVSDLMKFSRGVFGLSFLHTVFSRADVFALGKFYSPADLGLYTMAIYLIQVPAGFIEALLYQILLPTFSQIQTDHERINKSLLRVASLILFFGMPVALFIALSGHSLLSLVYGPRYARSFLPLSLAAGVAILQLLNSQITTVFYASGNPGLHRRCVSLMALLMLILITPSVKYFGMAGGQAAALVATTVGFTVQVIGVRRLTQFKLSFYANSLWIAAAIFSGVLVAFLATRQALSLAQPLPNVFFGALGGVVAFGISLIVLLWRTENA